MKDLESTLHPERNKVEKKKKKKSGSKKSSKKETVIDVPEFKLKRLKNLDIQGVETIKEAKRAKREILALAKKNRRVSGDLEDDYLDSNPEVRVPLVFGFGISATSARVFVLDHPENRQPRRVRRKVKRILKSILENKSVKKILHHGSYDVPQVKELLCKLNGYDYDTEYAEYFADPAAMAYGLASITQRKYPEYLGYKELVCPEAIPADVKYDVARSKGLLRMSKVPLKKLIPYNGMDCIITKRRELATRKKISHKLLKVYMDASFVIDRMEKFGPLLDYKHCETLEKIYPVRVKRITDKLRLMIRKEEFNPNSPVQVAKIIYRKLRLPSVSEEKPRGTGYEILQELYKQTNHPFPKLMMEYRDAYTIASRSLKSYRKSADTFEGRLRTKWWLTGTITGRLRSGGEKGKKKEQGIINLQNIHNNLLVKNLLVSDLNWRNIYDAWLPDFIDWKKRNISLAKYIWKELPDNASNEKKAAAKALKQEALDTWLQTRKEKEWEELFDQFLDYNIFLAFDYSQIEVRVFAQMAGDAELIAAFERGDDIHCFVGSALTGMSMDKIKNDVTTRVMIKGIHFGMLYGKKPPAIYETLRLQGIKTTEKKVTRMYNAYFERFEGVAELIKELTAMAEDEGYVPTMFGFKRPIGEDETRNSFWGNQAVNSPVQGTAHQMVLMAIALLKRRASRYNLLRHIGKKQGMTMEIHDSLDFVTKLRTLLNAFKQARQLTEVDVLKVVRKDFGIDWKVPLVSEGEAGFRFGTLVKLEKDQTLPSFMNSWCIENYVVDRELKKELSLM